MEGFAAKVGIPPERARESVFRFDGDKLRPEDTPEVKWGGRTGVNGAGRGGGIQLPCASTYIIYP